MSVQRLSTPTVIVNNEAVYVVPNSFAYTEGLGEQTVETQSSGGSSTETVFSDNAETKFSMVKFTMVPTESNIALARSWKTARNANAISATAGSFDKTFNNAAVVNNYEVALSSDGVLEIEFNSDPAV